MKVKEFSPLVIIKDGKESTLVVFDDCKEPNKEKIEKLRSILSSSSEQDQLLDDMNEDDFDAFINEEAAIKKVEDLYQMGLFIEEKACKAKAPKWFLLAYVCFRKAFEEGSFDALYKVACFLQTGQGVEKDPASASTIFKQLAMQNHTLAKAKLGCLKVWH